MKIKLKNRLGVLIEDCGVKSIQEMANRLKANQGIEISRTPLSRKINDDDVTLTLTLIEAICNELQCLPGDLFETEISDVTEEYLEGLRSRLQPFRYGSIRLKRPGAEEPAAEPRAAAREPKPRAAAKPAQDDILADDIAGPKVKHMNVAALKKTKT
jgi:DNA-binding Xre family transcriptional regulator